MQKRRRAGHENFVLVAFFIISSISLFLGLSLCLVKSPATTASYYVAASQHYIEQAEAENLQPEAVQYLLNQSRTAVVTALETDPYNADSWATLSLTLAKADEINRALQAREIAGLLGGDALLTISAMHNLLPPRPFILSDNRDHQTATQ